MRILMVLVVAAAATPCLLAGCELTPSDVGSSAARHRADEATIEKLLVSLEKCRADTESLRAATAGATPTSSRRPVTPSW